MMAGFAVSAPTASLLDVVGNPTGDRDKDSVPDEIEKQLCGRDTVRNTVLTQSPYLGRCNGTDWTPARQIVVVEILTDYKRDFVDKDKDGVPATVELIFTKYDINPFRDPYVIPTAGAPMSVPVDNLFSDSDASQPVVSKIDTGVEIPAMIRQGDEGDRDLDGLPAYLVLKMGKVMYDRSQPMPVFLEMRPDQKVAFDTNDGNPNEPVQSVVTAPVLTGASHDGDSDGDYLPHALQFKWMDVTIDRRSAGAGPKTADRTETLLIDDNDKSRNSHIPFNLIDNDGDVYPDEVEKVICMVQDEFDEMDGKCVRADGSGNDGDGDNYVAPKDVPNPWRIG